MNLTLRYQNIHNRASNMYKTQDSTNQIQAFKNVNNTQLGSEVAYQIMD